MTAIPISPQIWKLADAILTEKQKTVLELREKCGYSWNQLAIAFNCTRANVREIHAAATRNMLNAIEAAGGDIDFALERAIVDQLVGRDPFVPEPRPASEETLEEKTEYDRLWKETA